MQQIRTNNDYLVNKYKSTKTYCQEHFNPKSINLYEYFSATFQTKNKHVELYMKGWFDMRYDITVRYKNKEITVKGSKQLEGTWDLKDFISKTREISGLTYGQIHLMTDISEKRMKAIESGEIGISEENILVLQRVLKFPKKIVSIVSDKEKPLWAIRITELREEHYFTQTDVSKALGIAQTTYAGYETGRHEPDFETMIKIADIYKVSLDYLIGRY